MAVPLTAALREMAKRVVDAARQLDEAAGNSMALRAYLDAYEARVGDLNEMRALGAALVFGGLMRSFLTYVGQMLEPAGQNKPSLGKVAALLAEPGVADLIGQHMVGERTMPDVARLSAFPMRFDMLTRSHQYDAFREIKWDRPVVMFAPTTKIIAEYPGLFHIAEQSEKLVGELLDALGANPSRSAPEITKRQRDAARLFWSDYMAGTMRRMPNLDKL